MTEFRSAHGFFCEKGLIILQKDDIFPENPLNLKENNLFEYKIFPMNETLMYELGLDDKYDYLTRGIFDLKETLDNSSTIAFGVKGLNVFEIFSMKDFDDEMDFVVYCDQDCNMKNFGHKSLSELEYLEISTFLYGLAWDCVDFLDGEIYILKLIDLDNLPNLKVADSEMNVYRNRIIAKKMTLCDNIYIENISDIFRNKINISFLADESKLDSYRTVLNQITHIDMGDLVEVDGELYSTDKFVSEYIQNISKKSQKKTFLTNLFYGLII